MALAYYRDPATGTQLPLLGSDLNRAIADQLYLLRTGGTLSGPLVLHADPDTNLGAATRQYVDTKIAEGGGGPGGVAGMNRSIVTVDTSTTADSVANTDYIYLCTAAMTLTLPTAVANKNLYTVKRVGSGTVVVSGVSGQTFDGATTVAISVQYASLDIISDDLNWHIVGQYFPTAGNDSRYVTKSGNSTITGNLTVTGILQGATITEA